MTSAVDTLHTTPYLNGQPKSLYIDGGWVPAHSGKTFESINPSNGRVLGTLAEGDAADIDLAVAAARRAFEGPWSRYTPAQRQNVLLKLADLVEQHWDELRNIDILDMGAPVAGANYQAFTTQLLRYFAGWATRIHGETIPNSVSPDIFSYTLKEPIGVVGAIVPWNATLTSAFWKLSPALATGCTVVLKPAEESSLAPIRFAELVQELDLPPGVINIVTGQGETAGAALVRHPGVNKIAFTGSTAVGQEIVRASAGNLKRLSLELGGKSPDIVFADADLDAAVPGAAMAVFRNSGQICSAGTRVYVERPIYDEFVERVAAFADGLRVGVSTDPTTEIGPVVSQTQLDRVLSFLEGGPQEGARLVTGGERLTTGELGAGYFVPPTVFADVSDDMRLAREEIFGPVASILPFDDTDDVIRRANNSQYGLGGGVWTRDVGRAHRLIRRLDTGMVWVNGYGVIDAAVPFGGNRMSGWGRELSGHVLDEYLNIKSVWINATN